MTEQGGEGDTNEAQQSGPLEAAIKGSLPAGCGGEAGKSRRRRAELGYVQVDEDSLEGRADMLKGEVESGHSRERS